MTFGKRVFMKKKNYRMLLCRLSGILSLSMWFLLSSAGCKSRPKFPEGWRAGSREGQIENNENVQKKLDDALREFFESPTFDGVNNSIPEASE